MEELQQARLLEMHMMVAAGYLPLAYDGRSPREGAQKAGHHAHMRAVALMQR